MQTNYPTTIQELYDLQKFSIKMGLENITSLCHALGNPHLAYPVIHIAGTNGKGSTSLMINNILLAHGLKVGLYTSPHLIDFRERIRVNNRMIEKSYLINYWKNTKKLVNKLKATFFDTTTALAFDYFANSKVDIAVIETGLGGRLDSTNIVKPVSAVITPIAIDHIKQLGKDLRSIAKEKAVIVKKGATFFSAKQKKEVKQVFQNAAYLAESYFPISESIRILHKDIHPTYSQFDLVDRLRNEQFKRINLNLAGDFQMENSSLAYMVSRWYLEKVGISFSERRFRETLEKLSWPGRLQAISERPGIFLDVSHNYAGFRASVKFLSAMGEIANRRLLIGLLDDKEYKQIARLLSRHFKKIIVTQPAHERAIPVSVLSKELLRYGIQADLEPRIIPAYQMALKNLKKKEQLYVMGSHFIIGEILKVIRKKDLTQ